MSDIPKFCECYFTYKKYLQEPKKCSNKEINKVIYILYDLKYYKKCVWNDYVLSVRNLISSGIKRGGWKKDSKTQEILGCDFKFFKNYIENKFKLGMNWENHGKWHFDHIYPISKAKDKEHCLKLNHYTNFQPLWAADNISKGAKEL